MLTASVSLAAGHLHLYQWFSLLMVMLGVALVGLAGSLKPSNALETDALASDDRAARTFGGICLVLFSQLFTAAQVRPSARRPRA